MRAARVDPAGIVQDGAMASSGSVRSYDAVQGWGVIDGPDVPGGCWVHFSAIAVDGHRQLVAGQHVSFRAEAASQDGFPFRAVKVWTGDVEPAELPGEHFGSGSYRSTLSLTFDQPEHPDTLRP